MTGVLAVGRHAGPFLPRPTHVVHVDAEAVVDDPAALHDVVVEQLAMQGPLLVILPDALSPRLTHSLQLIRSALDHPPLLWHATSLPPLAADVLVTLAGALSGPLGGPASLIAVMRLLEQQIVHWTWVPSVTRVTDPAPTLMQHAQSSLPGSSWLISSWPSPAIVRMGADTPEVPRPGQPVGVAVADVDGDTSWIAPLITDHLTGASTVVVDAPADLAGFHGCRQITQVVLYPTAVDDLAAVLSARLDPGRCSWCHRDVGSAVCPWCAMPRSGHARIEERPGTALAPFTMTTPAQETTRP